MRVIGLMSGTSHDAIDAAAAELKLDGDSLVLTALGMVNEAYAEAFRQAPRAMAAPADRELWDDFPVTVLAPARTSQPKRKAS